MGLKMKKLSEWKDETMTIKRDSFFFKLKERSVARETWKESAEAIQERFERLDETERRAFKERAWLLRRALLEGWAQVVDGDELHAGIVIDAYFKDGSPYCTIKCDNGGIVRGALVVDGKEPEVEDDD